MTAILGLINFTGSRVQQHDLDNSINALSALGSRPSTLIRNHVGLHCNYLPTTIECDFDFQPLTHKSKRYTLLFDGRVDNRTYLTKRLNKNIEPIERISDSEIMLNAIVELGLERAIEAVIGEYALALWDWHNNSLSLSRDWLSNRSLYWTEVNNQLIFATQPSALFATGLVNRQINKDVIADLLYWIPSGEDECLYKGIYKVPAGKTVTFTLDKQWVTCNFQVDRLINPRFGSATDIASEFEEIFVEAVRCRLRSRGGIASHVSAGFDSSSVTSVAARELLVSGKNMLAFTAAPTHKDRLRSPGGLLIDESDMASLVCAKHPNVNHKVIPSTDYLFVDSILSDISQIEAPMRNPNNMGWIRESFRLARDQQCAVFLSGSFGNYGYSYNGAYSPANALSCLSPKKWASLSRLLRTNKSLSSTKSHFFADLSSLLPERIYLRLRAISGKVPIESRLSKIHPPKDWGYDLLARSSRHPTYRFRNRYSTYRDFLLSRLNYDNFALTNLAKHYGLDHRDPTADMRLLSFLLSIDESMFLMPRGRKSLILGSTARYLPDEVIRAEFRGIQAYDISVAVLEQRKDLISLLNECKSEASPEYSFLYEAAMRLISSSSIGSFDETDYTRCATALRLIELYVACEQI